MSDFKGGMLRALVWLLVLAVLLGFWMLADARHVSAAVPEDRSAILYPLYTPETLLQAAREHHFVPATRQFQKQLSELSSSAQAYCAGNSDLPGLQARYKSTLLAWLGLSAVVDGPMLSTHLVREIDFRPLRERLLERALTLQAQGALNMAQVGSPGRGLPALERLWFVQPVAAGEPACAYSLAVLQDIQTRVDALNWNPPNDAPALVQQYFNQVLGAVQALAWQNMKKPLLAHQDSKAEGPVRWPHSQLGLTEQAWQTIWRSVRHVLVMPHAAAPDPQQAVLPLEAYLRGLGHHTVADALWLAVERANEAISQLDAQTPASVQKASEALQALASALQTQVAPAMAVAVQFSSSDGD
ncbi:hypothetical protein [Limnobacter sp.]|uniref:hypothetical protein n=1 Tax=Limnobacter sp. TaxID=2003368 RepID=UPI00351441FC